jgi:hypothetical protein
MIGFIGFTGRENPRAIDGDVSIELGGELHKITQSSLVYIPKNVGHCPIESKNIRQPVLIFTIGNSAMWGRQKT